MNCSEQIKQRLKANAKEIVRENPKLKNYEEYETAVIWDSLQMNFHEKSFECIRKNEDWLKRTQKTHSKVKYASEMQSSNSSDALLMNIFCYPKIFDWKSVRDLLEITPPTDIVFGWNPDCFENEKGGKTEIDLKINNIIFEAKLTEDNFQSKDKVTVSNYADFVNVFHTDLLPQTNNEYTTYQLIRNILTAHHKKLDFVLLVDNSRVDLIRDFYDTVNAVKCPNLRKRMSFISWQELIDVCGKELKDYISKKYL